MGKPISNKITSPNDKSVKANLQAKSHIDEIFMQAPAIFALLRGPSHVFELANTFYRKIIGEHREIIGLPVKEALPELAEQGFLEILDRVYKTGRPFFGKHVLAKIDKDGSGQLSDAYFDFVYQPISHNDVINGILVHAVEVTEEVMAKNEAEERELILNIKARQQSVVTDLGMLALSEAGLSTLFNEATNKLSEVLDVEFTKILELLPGNEKLVLRAGTGWKEEVVAGKFMLGTGKDSQAGYTLDHKEPVIVIDLPNDKRFQGPLLLTDHQVVSGMSCIIWGKYNLPYGVLGVHSKRKRNFTNDDIVFLQSVANILAAAIQRNRDEQSLRESNEKLRESEERFRAMANNIAQLAWMTDETGWIYWYNQRWYDYTGTTLEEMQGWGWQKVHHPDTVEGVVARFKKALAAGNYWEDTFPLRSKDGEYRWFLSRAFPVRNVDGTLKGWFGTNTDITERENLAKQKDDFMGIASHELKTPVTSIKASIQIINRLFNDGSFEKAGLFLNKAEIHVDKLVGLINDLLDVSKIQAGKLQYNFSEFNINEVINDVAEQLMQQISKYRISINGEKNVFIYADKVRIEQVISNLLTNAIKYSPGSEEVILNISRQKDCLKVSVTDFGIGIPKEKIPHVFDRFFRVEDTSHQFQGLGLGLYICSEIVRRHGGTIGLHSKEGEGSVFWFTVPVRADGHSVNN